MNNDIKEILDKLSNRKEETLLAGLRECQLKNIEHPFITKEEYIDKVLDYITNLQQKYDRALEDSVKETHKLMAIRKYLKNNEREYGSLEDNEKIILGIIEGK